MKHTSSNPQKIAVETTEKSRSLCTRMRGSAVAVVRRKLLAICVRLIVGLAPKLACKLLFASEIGYLPRLEIEQPCLPIDFDLCISTWKTVGRLKVKTISFEGSATKVRFRENAFIQWLGRWRGSLTKKRGSAPALCVRCKSADSRDFVAYSGQLKSRATSAPRIPYANANESGPIASKIHLTHYAPRRRPRQLLNVCYGFIVQLVSFWQPCEWITFNIYEQHQFDFDFIAVDQFCIVSFCFFSGHVSARLACIRATNVKTWFGPLQCDLFLSMCHACLCWPLIFHFDACVLLCFQNSI